MTDDKSKGSSKQALIIESPDGIRIQISTSNKMKFRNAVNADKQLPEMMKSILYFLIDRTNDGSRDEPRKFGWAYPLPATIAEHCGCTVRTVWSNLAALEGGVTKDGVTVPERWRIRVNRHGQTKGEGGGRNKSSWYFLNAWHEFGAVDKPGATSGPASFITYPGPTVSFHFWMKPTESLSQPLTECLGGSSLLRSRICITRCSVWLTGGRWIKRGGRSSKAISTLRPRL